MPNPTADFPTAVHTPVDISAVGDDPLGATTPTHGAVHGKLEQEVVAIETKIGTGASPASSASTGQVLTKLVSGATAWADPTAGSGAVNSVNGQTDVVVLDQDDIADGTTAKQFTATEKTKLSGIETGATADQTAAEILTAIKTVDGAGSGLDADLLDGSSSAAFATAAQGAKADTATQPADIADFETTSELNTRDTANRARANHTGTQSADTVVDGTTNHVFTAADDTKLGGIEALADVTDAANVAAAGAFMKSSDDTDDITVGATNKFATAAEKTKLGFITVAQAVDLDTIETNANNVPGIKTKTDLITVTQAVDLDTMESDIAGKQPLDSDLTSIAGLSPTNDDVIQRKSGAWANRTMAQVKTDLVLVKGDVGLGSVTNDAQLKIASNLSDVNNAATSFGNIKQAASDTATGVVELATQAEVNTGSDTTRSITPDTLSGSVYGQKQVSSYVVDGATALSTGDGKSYIRIPAALNGMNLIMCASAVVTTSSSGNPTVMVSRGRQSSATSAHSFVDMLTTALTIDALDYDSKDAGTPAVIDTSNDDVATGDLIRIDVDTAGTGTKGLIVTLTFQAP